MHLIDMTISMTFPEKMNVNLQAVLGIIIDFIKFFDYMDKISFEYPEHNTLFVSVRVGFFGEEVAKHYAASLEKYITTYQPILGYENIKFDVTINKD